MRISNRLIAKTLLMGLMTSTALAQTPSQEGNSSGGGGGSVSVTASSANIVINPTPGTGTFTVGATFLVDARTSTTEAIIAADAGKLVTFNNGSATAASLAQATGSFGSGWSTTVENLGAGTVTVTPATSTINGASTLVLAQNTGCDITSDGTNYQVSACTAVVTGGGVPSIAGTANQINESGSPGATTLSLSLTLLAPGTFTSTGAATFSAGATSAIADAATNTISYGSLWNHTSSGTAAAGFGYGQKILLQNGAGSLVDSIENQYTLTTTTAGSESAQWVVQLISSGTLATRFTFSPGNGLILTTSAAIAGAGTFAWSGRGVLSSPTTGTVQIGGTDVASPVAQTLKAQGVLTATSNTAGVLWTFKDSVGTGTGASGGYQWNVAAAGSTGSTPNTEAKAMGLDSTGALTLPNLASSSSAQTGTACWTTGTGNITIDTTTTCLLSLEELKDIQPGGIREAMPEIMELEPFWYTWKKTTAQWKVDQHVQPGLGAHAVEKVDPRLVGYDTKGKLHGVRYPQMVALLIAGMKEQQREIGSLQLRLDKAEGRQH